MTPLFLNDRMTKQLSINQKNEALYSEISKQRDTISVNNAYESIFEVHPIEIRKVVGTSHHKYDEEDLYLELIHMLHFGSDISQMHLPKNGN